MNKFSLCLFCLPLFLSFRHMLSFPAAGCPALCPTRALSAARVLSLPQACSLCCAGWSRPTRSLPLALPLPAPCLLSLPSAPSCCPLVHPRPLLCLHPSLSLPLSLSPLSRGLSHPPHFVFPLSCSPSVSVFSLCPSVHAGLGSPHGICMYFFTFLRRLEAILNEKCSNNIKLYHDGSNTVKY